MKLEKNNQSYEKLTYSAPSIVIEKIHIESSIANSSANVRIETSETDPKIYSEKWITDSQWNTEEKISL